MSIEAVSWALSTRRVATPMQRLVLIAVANHADKRGQSAWPSQETLAEYCCCSSRTIRRQLSELEESGIIRRGDQRLVSHFRGGYRPVVYDVDLGGDEPANNSGGDRTSAADLRPDNLSRLDTGVHRGRTSATLRPDTGVLRTVLEPSIEPSNSVGFSLAKTDAPQTDRFETPREDVEQLCSTLQAMMVERGCRKPSITRKWRDAARLLLDRDKIPLNEALIVLAWSQKDEFWQGNIMSMPTFRKQYDKLKVQAKKGLDTVPEVRAAIYAAAAEEFEADMAARDRRALR